MNTREFTNAPEAATTYARAVIGSVLGKHGEALPQVELIRRNVRINPAHLAQYKQVCGFASTASVPATYPFVLAFAQQMALITDPAFPFPAMGLVHLQNRIQQHRPIREAESLTLAVKPANLRPHSKGLAFDILITVRTDAGEVVWEAVSTTLRRQAHARATAPRPPVHATPPVLATQQMSWSVPADTGRRYARVSGDRNPIHLYAFTAKMFGFSRAVAHGMWLKARCLAALEHGLPDTYSVDVAFKTPVLMPADLVFQTEEQEEGATAFSLRAAHTAVPHLVGTLQP